MITEAVISIINYLPDAHIWELPIFGSQIYSALSSAVLAYYGAVETIPFLDFLSDVFVYVIIPFEMMLLALKVFLGNHRPIND